MKEWIVEYWMPILALLLGCAAVILAGVLVKRMGESPTVSWEAKYNVCVGNSFMCISHLTDEYRVENGWVTLTRSRDGKRRVFPVAKVYSIHKNY